MSLPVWASRSLQAGLALLWALPLVSLAPLHASARPFLVLVSALAATAFASSTAALVGLGILTALAFAIVRILNVPLAPAFAAEALVLAFLVGHSLRLAVRGSTGLRLRLTPPVLALAATVVAWMLVASSAQFNSVGIGLKEAFTQLTAHHFTGPWRIAGLQASFRWLEVLAMAVAIERSLRLALPRTSLVAVAWLGASVVAAAQSAVLVIEATIHRGEGWRDAVEMLQNTRLGAVVSDVNAAGSLFALLAVTAVVLAMVGRRWSIAIVVAPFLVFGLVATQSRSALAAAVVVLGVLAVRELDRRRLSIAAAAVAVAIAAGGVTIILRSAATHTPAERALDSRVGMWRVALKMSADQPVFGVGPGRFQAESHAYIEPAFVKFFPEAVFGENAHNNFLQVMGELGLVGFAGFVWLLLAATGRHPGDGPAERVAVLAGLGAFLLSSLLGHPLLIFEVSVSFFFAIGLAAALAPAPTGKAPRLASLLVVFVILTLPFRLWAVTRPAPPTVEGASAEMPALDDVMYREADQESLWRIRPRALHAAFPLRWRAPAAGDCRVEIRLDDRVIDRVTLRDDAWTMVRVQVPPGRPPQSRPEFHLKTSAPECRLLVGTVESWR